MDWMLMPLRRFSDFQGRSRRKEYWFFVLFSLLLAAPIIGMEHLIGIGGSIGDIYGPISVVLLLVLFVPSIACGVRRFHDQDKTGWLVLLQFVPLVNIVFLIFMVLDGNPGPNRFGPDPKAGERGPVGYNGPANEPGGPDRI